MQIVLRTLNTEYIIAGTFYIVLAEVLRLFPQDLRYENVCLDMSESRLLVRARLTVVGHFFICVTMRL